MDSILGSWIPYIALALTVAGWFVTNNASAKREIRKERRAEVDACCVMAASLYSKSIKYYTSSSSAPDAASLATEIKFDLYRLTRRIETLEKRCPKFDMEGLLVELHGSLTGANFESVSRAALSHEATELLTIEADVHAVMDGLEDGFDNSFKS